MQYINTCDSVTVFADRLTGADSSYKIQSAIDSLPATGGIVDARALPNESSGGLTKIDPGTKPITLLLPPVTVYVNYIRLQKNFRILGSGCGVSIIQAASTTQAPIISSITETMQHMELADFQVKAAPGSAYDQDGMCISIDNPSQGMWYSKWSNLVVQDFGGIQINLDGAGGGIGKPTLGDHQFNTIRNVMALRKNVLAWTFGTNYKVGQTVTINDGTVEAYHAGKAYLPGTLVYSSGVTYMCIAKSAGNAPPDSKHWVTITQLQTAQTYVCTLGTSGTQTPLNATYWAPYASYALQELGSNGQFVYENCEFSGHYGGPNSGININLQGKSFSNFCLPYSNSFIKQTCQYAALGMYISGVQDIHFKDPHFEAVKGGILVDHNSAAGLGAWGLKVEDGHWLTSACINGGAGYAASFTSKAAAGQADLTFEGNDFFSTADNMIMGGGSSYIVVKDNNNSSGQISNGPYSGVIPTIPAAPSITTNRAHVAALTGETMVNTITSLLGPGEQITFYASSGPISFGTSGNLKLGNVHASLTVPQGGSATFVYQDVSSQWVLVSAMSGNGSSVVAKLDLTDQRKSISPTTLYTVPTNAAGLYRITAAIVTTKGSGSATVVARCGSTNDGGSSTIESLTSIAQLSTSGWEGVGAATVYCTEGSAITCSATTSGTVGLARFSVRFRVEYLG
jgi:hypothetical protein